MIKLSRRFSKKSFLAELLRQIAAREKQFGFTRHGWAQADGLGPKVMFEYGRYAQLCDLIMELSE